MIVEDDPMVAELNRRYLEQVEGFTLVASARSVDEALSQLGQHHIDLILLDIFMPGMNGLELLARIRETGRAVDVILVTAACDSHSINEALRSGAVDYLIKPFEFERLHAALSRYRERAVLIKEQPVLTQSELDQCILCKTRSAEENLPKGLDRNTLNKVWENIRQIGNNSFTTEELANFVGISRVSMRKYLGFLKQIGVVSLDVTYGAVGRPVYKYRCVSLDSDFIKRYL